MRGSVSLVPDFQVPVVVIRTFHPPLTGGIPQTT
jgi:hypothetical protein